MIVSKINHATTKRMNTEIVKRYRCLPRRSRNLVNVALTYERLLADYSYSSERPFKRKSDRVCNFHVRFSLPFLPFLPFPDRRLGVTPVTRTRPHAFARNFARTSYALVSFLLVSSHLISSHLISTRLVSFCFVWSGYECAHAVRNLSLRFLTSFSLFEEANEYKSPFVSRLVSLFTNSLHCARNDLVNLEHSNN